MAQPSECSVLLARWTASHPDSPRLAQAARDMRSADYTGTGANALPDSIIEALVQLYRGRPLTASDSPGPVRNAVATSNIYAAYFHHAFPFDRKSLLRAWSRCESDQRTVLACAAARRQAERELGPIHSKSAPP
jgi:hypothetical protein